MKGLWLLVWLVGVSWALWKLTFYWNADPLKFWMVLSASVTMALVWFVCDALFPREDES